MSSISISRTTYKHSCDKYNTTDTNDSIFSTDALNINGNSYANTPSPSSTTSSMTQERSMKRSKKDHSNIHMLTKLRYRHEKVLNCTDSITRQYIITMTNIIFHMQKQINKLKRRTYHVEQKLAKQTQVGQPIIRIPRLTKDELSDIYVKDKQTMSEKVEPSDETEKDLSVVTEIKRPSDVDLVEAAPLIILPKGKYCAKCKHEFSHRSGYLRHMRRVHHADYSKVSELDANNSVEVIHPEQTVLTTDQSIDAGTDNDPYQMLVNPWDIGEGRLRPRRVSKSYSEPVTKVKCDMCNKYFRDDYIKKHKRRNHSDLKSCDSHDDITCSSINTNQQSIIDVSPVINSDPAIEMDIDNHPIEDYYNETNDKTYVLATTYLENYQLEIVKEFVQKFSSRISQTSIVDSRTTHLIVNDDRQHLRSPASIKLVEGIAHHCFCVSYRWLIDCLKYDRIIDESSYEIEGDDTDPHLHGGPKRSRLYDKHHALFEGICFMIKCTENNAIPMTNDRLQRLILTCGGQIITCVTQDYLDQYKIIVLCDRLYVSERRHNYDQCRSLKIEFLSSKWVLDSILEYRLKSMETYLEKPM